MAGPRRSLVVGLVSLALMAGSLTASSAANAQTSVGDLAVPTSVLQELLSRDQGLFVALPSIGGMRFDWTASSLEFIAADHRVVASGGGLPPLELASSLAGASNASSVAGRLVVDSQPASGREVVYFPFDGGVETLDVITGPASPHSVRWTVTTGGQPLVVDVDRGTAALADGTVVARFDGASAYGADGQPVEVTLRGGPGLLDLTIPTGLSATTYPVVIDPNVEPHDQELRRESHRFRAWSQLPGPGLQLPGLHRDR